MPPLIFCPAAEERQRRSRQEKLDKMKSGMMREEERRSGGNS
jgi:hypothetical protein